MVRFTGRAPEVITVLNKPIPTGIKVWNLRQRGFFLKWNWHRPEAKFGLVNVKVSRALRGSASSKEGNKTQAIVLHLL
jgi:hypothetical protein